MHQRTVPCQYFTPQKIEEALEILSRYGKEIKIIAGGTDLLIQYYDRLYEINGWLDLKNIKELKEIKIHQNQMEIGAMVSHTQLEKSAEIKKIFSSFRQGSCRYRLSSDKESGNYRREYC